MDVKSSFLYGDLNEETYMENALGFVQDSSLSCRLSDVIFMVSNKPLELGVIIWIVF